MPQIILYGAPKLSSRGARNVDLAILKAVLSITELVLTEHDVSVNILADQNPGCEIIVQISELWDKPKRTFSVRNRLAQAVGEAVKREFQALQSYTDWVVVVRMDPPFDPTQGFWTSRS